MFTDIYYTAYVESTQVYGETIVPLRKITPLGLRGVWYLEGATYSAST